MSHRKHDTFGSPVVVGFLLIVTPIVGVFNCSMFCCTLHYIHSSIAIILMGKRELVALLNLSSWCLVMVEWLFLAVQWGCLRFVIMVFPDHTSDSCYLFTCKSMIILLLKSRKQRKYYSAKCFVYRFFFSFFVSMGLTHLLPSLRDISCQLTSYPMTFV